MRKNRTDAYFESLKKRLTASEDYNAYLLSELEKCRKEHGGAGLDTSYLQRRPPALEGSLDDVDPTDYGGGDDSDTQDIDNSMHGLIAPIQRLTVSTWIPLRRYPY